MQAQTANAGQQMGGGQQVEPAAQPVAEKAGARLRVSFGINESAQLAGMSYYTLRHWCRKGWAPFNGGFSAWQVIALACISASNRGKGTGAYLGDVAVRRAMESVEGLDDALLLAESDQDLYIAEAASMIASAALPNEELSPEMYESLGMILETLDRKVRGTRNRVSRRVPRMG